MRAVTGKLLRASLVALALAPAIASLLLTIAPDLAGKRAARRAAPFTPPSWIQPAKDGGEYLLGTDYLGRPFIPVLCSATAGTVRIALLGTGLVMLGCLAVGVIHGSIRSRGL